MKLYNPATQQYVILQPAGYDEYAEYRNGPRGFPDLYERLQPSGHRPGPPRPSEPRPSVVIRPRPQHVVEPAPAQPVQTPAAPPSGADYLTIKKSSVTDLVSLAGKAWASFLIRPDMPETIGDDIIDRTNATLHRDALAMHQQNQTRIAVLTDLATRAVKLFT